jgi:plasmid stabilization system protein ParE
MSFPLVFHPAVQDEIEEAYRWYEQHQTGLGQEFLRALDEVFNRLRQTPGAHQLIYKNVRRALPRRFPYSVFYRILADRVEVIAVQHSRRDRARWQSRA